MSSNKLKTLKRFSIANIKSAPLKILIRTILVFLIIVVAYFSLNKYYIEASTYEINDTITGYFTDLNKKDFNHIQKYLYPDVGNRTYALAIGAKSVATGMQSIHLQRIYPALIDGEIGIVGFETTTKNFYQGQEVVLKETNTFIVKRFQGEWYITKPSDLRDYRICKSAMRIDLPEEFRLNNKNIKDQGSVNSCVAHALSSTLENKFDKNFSTGWIYTFRLLSRRRYVP